MLRGFLSHLCGDEVTTINNALQYLFLSHLCGDEEADAYLVSEKSGKGVFESTINAMAYDSRYYPNDQDFINGLIA